MKIILCYHRISDIYDDFNLMNVSIHNFDMHMQYIKKNYEIVSLEQLMENAQEDDGRDQIAVTFDDGYRDVYRNAFPILEKYQIPATAFITTGNIDTQEENWPDIVMRACVQPAIYHEYFDIENNLITMRCYTRNLQERSIFNTIMGDLCARLSLASRNEQMHKLMLWAGIDKAGRESRQILNSEEIRILAKSSLMTIGSHTVTHPMLKCLSEEEQLNEIKTSQNKLEWITEKKHSFFAYPYGGKDAFDEITVRLLKQRGYQLAVTTEPKDVVSSNDLFQVPRYVVYNYRIKDFKQVISGILQTKKIEVQDEDNVERKSKKETPLVYMGVLEADTEIMSGKRKIIIWGYGHWGRELYAELERLNLETNVIAFGDKEAEKFRSAGSRVPVMCAEEITENLDLSEVSILIKGVYDWDIVMELKKKGFNNLHLIMR